VSRPGHIHVVGLGPGRRETMTPQAIAALEQADVIIGYSGYFAGLDDLTAGKECLALPLAQEIERAQLALDRAREGLRVCVISSGDAGVYGMASLVLETVQQCEPEDRPEVVIVPGISALQACASLLGAPLAHDFAVISLSDLLTPWEKIERRLEAAAGADFVLALFNPKSQRRDWQLARAQQIIARHRVPQTPVGVVANAYRAGQRVEITTVEQMAAVHVDMLTTVIVGNSQTARFESRLVTPRGYLRSATHGPAHKVRHA
jgi:precorrin-3B C17-methyltransferase / cobalt-factor III methyltransferase